jgi:hypothetical protein
VTICLPATRTLPPSKMPAATSSSPASIKPSPSISTALSYKCIARPSANVANAPPLSIAGSTPCRCAATDDAILVNWFSIEIHNAKGKRTYTTASSRISRSRPAPSPNWPPAAAPGGRSKTRPSTCSRPTVTTSNITLGTARKPCQRSGHLQPACLRFPHRRLSRRHRLARRRRRPWSDISLLRAPADHHHLCRLPGLAPSAPVNSRGGATATLTRAFHRPATQPI